MIVYNMRYRGAIEYEKMLLNVLSFHNHVEDIISSEKELTESEKTIASYIAKCDKVIASYADTTSYTTKLYQAKLNHFIPSKQSIAERY